jgi:hypothetical protein
MRDTKVRAEAYRKKAAEVRALAEADKHVGTRDALLKIAEDYERLAKSLDALAESKEALRRD